MSGCDDNMKHGMDAVFSSPLKVMVFSSHEDFQQTIDHISHMSDEELNAWEKSNGFTSFRTVLNQAYAELDAIETAEQEFAFQEKYKDVISSSDDQYLPLIEIKLYQCIANREGIYETNGYLNKIMGDYIVTVKKDEYDKLNLVSVIPEDKKSLERMGIRITQYASTDPNTTGRLSSTCSTYEVASYFHNESNCRHDREVYISGKSYIALSTSYEGDLRQPRVHIEVWGKIRSGTWCKWRSYATMLYYRNVSFTIDAWAIENSVAVPRSYSVVVPDDESPNDYTVLTWDASIGAGLLNQLIAPAPFTSLHAEGTSRGVDGVWVVLDCQ